jgi:uncharacterized protein (DUF362 family)
MDTITAGQDPVATDATASRVVGFDPQGISYIAMAHERGLGEIDEIEVLGESIESVKRVFKKP